VAERRRGETTRKLFATNAETAKAGNDRSGAAELRTGEENVGRRQDGSPSETPIRNVK
jgi:hypothetical protein